MSSLPRVLLGGFICILWSLDSLPVVLFSRRRKGPFPHKTYEISHHTCLVELPFEGNSFWTTNLLSFASVLADLSLAAYALPRAIVTLFPPISQTTDIISRSGSCQSIGLGRRILPSVIIHS